MFYPRNQTRFSVSKTSQSSVYPIGHVLSVFENYKRTWPVNLRLDGEVIVLWKPTYKPSSLIGTKGGGVVRCGAVRLASLAAPEGCPKRRASMNQPNGGDN